MKLEIHYFHCFSLFFDDICLESFLDLGTMSFMYDYRFDCTSLCLVCCQCSQQKRWEKHIQHLARDQGANTYGLTCTTIAGFPKGSVWLGAIWLNLVLRNPQPTPSAWRPRCAEPARPVSPSNTTVALSFMVLYSLRHSFSCSPVTCSLGVQIRRIKLC